MCVWCGREEGGGWGLGVGERNGVHNECSSGKRTEGGSGEGGGDAGAGLAMNERMEALGARSNAGEENSEQEEVGTLSFGFVHKVRLAWLYTLSWSFLWLGWLQ